MISNETVLELEDSKDDSWAKEVEDKLDRKYPERRCHRHKRSPWDDFDMEALPPWWFYD